IGIGSLKAFNLALLQKWRWRLVTISNSLWTRVVKVIHGDDTGMELKGNEETLEILKTEIGHVQVNDCQDIWHWNGADDGVFSVNVTRLHVDNCIFPSLSPSTRWSKILPRVIQLLAYGGLFVFGSMFLCLLLFPVPIGFNGSTIGII
ncbi:hypothetical protein Tco_1450486, partial [Tanacetum coccineum]